MTAEPPGLSANPIERAQTGSLASEFHPQRSTIVSQLRSSSSTTTGG
jgi:hypothetical protein